MDQSDRFRMVSAIVAAAALGLPTVQASAVVIRLEPGAIVERRLEAGPSDTYALALPPGTFLHVVVEQRGVDTVEELLDARGERLIRVDSARGAWGPESLRCIVQEGGEHRLTVRTLLAGAHGSYRIRIAALRPASADDRGRAAAALLHQRYRDFEQLRTPNDRRESLAGLERAAAAWAAVGEPIEEALTLYDVGRALQFRAENREAKDWFLRAQARAESASDAQLQARIQGSLGLSETFLGDPEESLRTLARSETLARAAGDPQQEAFALHTQAWSHWNAGRIQQTLDLDRRALAIARSNGDREIEAWALSVIGIAELSLGEIEQSIRESEQAIAIWAQLDERYAEGFALQNAGFAYWMTGRVDKARRAYERALETARAMGDRQGEALALNNIGLAETDAGDPEAGAATLRRSIEIWKSIGIRHGEALALRNLGHALAAQGRNTEALAATRESLGAARLAGDRLAESSALTSLAGIDLSGGDLDAATREVEASLAIVESTRGALGPQARSSFLSASQDVYAIAIEARLRLHEREPGAGNDAAAFRLSEQGRARALAEAIAESHLDLSSEVPAELREREAALGARLNALQKAASASAREEEELRRAEDEWDGLVAEVRRRAPRYASLRYPEPATAAQARARLDPTAAIVSYTFLPGGRLAAFVLSAGRFAAVRLDASSRELADSIENYVGLLGRDETNRWDAMSAALYDRLVAPWRRKLPSGVRRLVIVPDGVLHSLPFETLTLAGSAPRRLVDDFAISYAPSATVLGELGSPAASGSPRAPADLLVIAGPSIGAAAVRTAEESGEERFELSPLPFAALEARTIGRYGGSGSEIHVGPAASEDRIKRRGLDRFGIVHFATHALVSPRTPSRSALLLTPSSGDGAGLLTAREIYGLRLSSELVVLSSCRTARGRILAGEGVESLAHAFFHAGARSLVASLWDVNDRRTAELMGAFYDRLAAGSGKADALREAKLEMLRASPGLAPRYWASFVLIGEPNATVPLRRPERRAWGEWAIAAAVVGGVVWATGRVRQRRAILNGKGPSFVGASPVSSSTVQK